VPASPPRRWPAAAEGTLKPSLNFCPAQGVQGAPDFVVPTPSVVGRPQTYVVRGSATFIMRGWKVERAG
jgi:hypothetical protein